MFFILFHLIQERGSISNSSNLVAGPVCNAGRTVLMDRHHPHSHQDVRKSVELKPLIQHLQVSAAERESLQALSHLTLNMHLLPTPA